MAVTAANSQGPVDRLATYFFRRFQETKKESELAEFQSSTQLKFDEVNKTVGSLKDEMRAFWDNAPEVFLPQFAEQLHQLAGAQQDQTEAKLDCLNQRLDEAILNWTGELNNVSSKTVVGTATLHTALEATQRQIKATEDMVIEKVHRYESSVRTCLASLSDQQVICADLQKTNRALEDKVAKLETITERLSEQMIVREGRFQVLEMEMLNMAQWSNIQRNENESIKRSLLCQQEELKTLRAEQEEWIRQQQKEIPKMAPPVLATPDTMPSNAIYESTGLAVKQPPMSTPSQHARRPSTPTQSRKRHPEQKKAPAVGAEIRQERAVDTAPSPKRQRTGDGLGAQTPRPGDLATIHEIETPSTIQATPRTVEAQTTEASIPRLSTRTLRKRYIRPKKLPAKDGQEANKKEVITAEKEPEETKLEKKTEKEPEKKKLEEERTKFHEPQKKSERKPEEPEPTQPTTPAHPTPLAPPQNAKRAAIRAFAAHAKHFAKEYNYAKPRSERQFIWLFLDNIPDPGWARYVQEQLLETYPAAVQRSLRIRAKHMIDFGDTLTWRDVVALIRAMQQKTVPPHLDGR